MTETAAGQSNGEAAGISSLREQLPVDSLLEGGRNLLMALAQRGLSSVTDRMEETTERLTDYAEQGGPGLAAALTGVKSMAEGESPLKAAMGAGMSGVKDKVQRAFGGGSADGSGGGGGGGSMKFTNIVEQIDVGVPVRVAYNQWTQFQDFPEIMKKVERVDPESDEEEEQKLNWKAQVLWSHRSWEATVLEQVPDERIVWESTGQLGHVDGAVTFHELAPNLTRILFVLVYHQKGFVEGTANLWRAAGRRARLEIKHFRRHVMTQTILNPDEVEGWRGEIHDGKVVKTHEQALQEEQEASGEYEEPTEEYGEYEEEPERAEEREPADGEAGEEREPVSEAPAEYEDEYDEESEPEPATTSRRR